MAEYKINFMWDSEAYVWVATSDDVQGLALEHGSLDALMERVKYAVPELLELNEQLPPIDDIALLYNTFRSERLVLNG